MRQRQAVVLTNHDGYEDKQSHCKMEMHALAGHRAGTAIKRAKAALDWAGRLHHSTTDIEFACSHASISSRLHTWRTRALSAPPCASPHLRFPSIMTTTLYSYCTPESAPTLHCL